MDSTRSPLLHITPLGHDPVRMCDDDDTDAALRRDLATSCDAVVVGLDHAALEAQLLAVVVGSPRDACG